jgi:hypothetical protein
VSGTITNVVKGKMLENADARLRLRVDAGETPDDYVARMEELLRWYSDPDVKMMEHIDHASSMTSAGKDHLVAMDDPQKIHTRDEFFGDGPKAYFPDIPGDVEDQVVRAGYITALQLALQTAKAGSIKPIVSYWIITDLPSDKMETFVSETEREIHVMILTPRPVKDFTVREEDAIPEDMFVVSTKKRINEIVEYYPEIYAEDYRSPVDDSTPDVERLRVIGY